MSLKKILIIIGSVTGILLIILSALLAKSFEKPTPDVGIVRPETPVEYQKPQEEEQQTIISKEDKVNLESQIEGCLSAGQFKELDDILKSYIKHYKDAPHCNESVMQMIDRYRADLALVFLIQKDDLPLDGWLFETPDVLAAAYAYLPIKTKYLAPYNSASAIFPAAKDNINLTERSLSKKESYQLLQTISYNGSFEVHTVKLYDVTINDEPVELVMMIDPETRQWVLYEVRTEWEGALTCEEVNEMIENYGVEDIDAIVLM